MKTIVIDARNLTSSSGRYTLQLLTKLQQVDTELSHRYKVLLRPKDMESWNPTSKRFTKVSCPYPSFSFAEQWGLAIRLYRLRPDVVHFTAVSQPLLYFGHSLTTVQELTPIRFGSDTRKRRYKTWLYRTALRKTPRIITPSEFTKDDVARFAHINSRKLIVINEGSDSIQAKASAIPELEGKQFISYVGRGLIHKNLPRLLEAFRSIQTQKPELHLVFAGKLDGGYKQLQKLVQKDEIANVVFTDYLEDSQLKWLYENTTAYVFPSESEGFGLPGLEAMAHGAPVVSSNAGALPETYGDAALYFNPEDVEDMAKKITKILTDTAKRKSLISAGKKQAQKYSSERMASQTLTLYKTILKES